LPGLVRWRVPPRLMTAITNMATTMIQPRRRSWNTPRNRLCRQSSMMSRQRPSIQRRKGENCYDRHPETTR
jgi:hypothetical protein